MLKRNIPLIKPFINDAIKAKVLEILDSGYLTEGPVTHALEDIFCTYIGTIHAVAFTSCTTGLETSLRALGIKSGDEIIIPDYTYPATASVVNIVGADAVIVDINPRNMLIDYDEIEKVITSKTKAIMPVSLFGNPLDYDRLNSIKHKYGLYIIEDAACSIGTSFQGVKTGKLADISVFSMHPRKFITTGEGGMLTTENQEWAEWIQSYKHFGLGSPKPGAPVLFDQIGTNYKLSDLLSAVGLEQMRLVDELLDRRICLANNYKELIGDIEQIELPSVTHHGVHAYQSFCVFIENRNQVMLDMINKGIEVQIGTYSLHKQPAYSDNDHYRLVGEMKGSMYAYDHALTLPLFHELTFDDQDYIIEELLTSIRKIN